MKDRMELVFILDRSGSMGGLEADTIGGFNALLNKQKAQEGDVTVTTVLFNNGLEILHDRLDIQALQPISDRDYYVGGNTALYDAIGYTIEKIDRVQHRSMPEHRAKKVLFVITTDGMENASRNYRLSDIRVLIERQKLEYGWEFLFLGANIDAEEVGGRFGIDRDKTANYHADKQGTYVNYSSIDKAVNSFRHNDSIVSDWKSEIDEDFTNRKKQ